MKSKIVFHDLKMEIHVETGIIARYYSELMYIVHDAPYSWLYFTGRNRYRVCVSLQKMMSNLPEALFMKCRRSVIINVCYYKEYDLAKSMVVMEDGREFFLTEFNVLEFNAKRGNMRFFSPCEKCEARMNFCRMSK